MREVRFGLTVLCRGCKSNIRLAQKDATIDQAKATLDDFQNQMNKIFKNKS